jgi:hypothetical protein
MGGEHGQQEGDKKGSGGCSIELSGTRGALRREDRSREAQSAQREVDERTHTTCSMPCRHLERVRSRPKRIRQGLDRSCVRPGTRAVVLV